MKLKILLGSLLTILIFTSPVFANACDDLEDHACYGQEEKCEFTVNTNANHDLRAQDMDYVEYNHEDRNWFDLKEIKNSYTSVSASDYTKSGASSNYNYEPCTSLDNWQKCGVMPLERLVVTDLGSIYAEWTDWTADKYGYYLEVDDEGGGYGTGCVHLRPKEGFLIKLKVVYTPDDEGESYAIHNFLKRGSTSIYQDWLAGRNSERVIHSDNALSANSWSDVTVILDGDNRDYLSADISNICENIATFKIQMSEPNGDDWIYSSDHDELDTGSDHERVLVMLMGYENKDFAALVIDKFTKAGLQEGANAQIIDIEVNEGEKKSLSSSMFPTDAYKIRINEPYSQYRSNWNINSNKPKINGWTEETTFGYGRGFDQLLLSELGDIKIDATTVKVNADKELGTIMTYSANRNTANGETSYSTSKSIKVIIKDTNIPISTNSNNPSSKTTDEYIGGTDSNSYSVDVSGYCVDPDSDIQYTAPKIVEGENSLIKDIRFSSNKLRFNKVIHKTGTAKVQFECHESEYSNKETIDLNIVIENQYEDISVVGATPLSGYDLGQITISTEEGVEKEFDINLENYDSHPLSSPTPGVHFITNNNLALNVDSVDLSEIKLKYTPQAPISDSYDLNVVTEGTAKKLKINFEVSNVNSAINWDDEVIPFTTNEDFSKTITIADFAGKYTDDGNSIAYIEVIEPLNLEYGTLTHTNSQITYTPHKDAVGTDTFWIKATDDYTADPQTSDLVEIEITILPKNDAPTLSFPGEYSSDLVSGIYMLEIYEDSEETDSTNTFFVETNDIDEDKVSLRVSTDTVDHWSDSNFKISEEGYITVIPTENFEDMSGKIIGIYANDGALNSADSLGVKIKVIGVNDLPISTNSSVSTYIYHNYQFKTNDFNFLDIDLTDSLQSISINKLPSHGELKIDSVEVSQNMIIASGDINKLIYYPDSGVIGKDLIEFSVSDGIDYSNSYTLDIDVLQSPYGENSHPKARGGYPIFNTGWACKPGYELGEGITLSTILTAGEVCIPEKNELPTANIFVPEIVQIGKAVAFSGANSVDPDGTIVSYTWEVAPNVTKDGIQTTHTYLNMSECPSGICQIKLTVMDDSRESDSTTKILTLTESEIEVPDYTGLNITLGATYDEGQLNFLALSKSRVNIVGDEEVTVDSTGKVTKIESRIKEYGGANLGKTSYIPFNNVCEAGELQSATP